MKLNFPKLFEKEAPGQYYLALILRNEKVTSVIFEKEQGVIRYINSDEEYFSNTLEDATNEEFLDTLDKSITRAESSLPENVETHKTLFGLKESWIEDDKIKKEYLDKLKHASSELSLDPIGFLGYTESIINLIQSEEGAPITAVLCDIGKKYISVSLIKAGKIVETKSSEIHQGASYTVDTLLKHFKTPEVMPARVIILDSEEDELTQEFLTHTWSKDLPFLHIPQIMSLPEDASIKAMLMGASTKMGGRLVYEKSKEDKDENLDEAPTTRINKEEKKLDYVGEDSSMEYFGFVEGADIAKTEKEEVKIPKDEIRTDNIEEQIDEIPQDVKNEQENKTPLPANISLAFAKFKNSLPKVFSFLKKIKFNKELLKNRNFLLGAGIVTFLILLFAIFNILGKSATVNVLVSAKQDQRDASVTFSPNSSTDIDNLIISSDTISVSQDGTATTNTSGKEDVGEKAKGTVTIFNNSDSPVSFSSGTKITSSNSLDFTLDSSVNVASATGDIFSGTKPGTANVGVSATGIGQEYNLPSGTKFSIGTNSDIAAKNDNAFSGGTKKSITVVSKADLDKLLKKLPKDLEQKAKEQLKSKSQDGRQILDSFTDESIESQSFDKKEGDTAANVTLKATVKYTTVSFSSKDIQALSSTLFKNSQNAVDAKDLEIVAKNIGIEKNDDITADITIKANIFPKLDSLDVANEIKGTTPQKAKNIILNIDQVKSVEIKLSPNIPFLNGTLPSNPKKIKINVTSN